MDPKGWKSSKKGAAALTALRTRVRAEALADDMQLAGHGCLKLRVPKISRLRHAAHSGRGWVGRLPLAAQAGCLLLGRDAQSSCRLPPHFKRTKPLRPVVNGTR